MVFRPENAINRDNVQRHFGVELDPCPFCAAVESVVLIMSRTPHVECLICGAEGPQKQYAHSQDTHEQRVGEALRGWNKTFHKPPENRPWRSNTN